MSFDAHANFAYSLVSVAPSPALSGTTLTVLDGSLFPDAPFNAVVYPIAEFPLAANAEIIRVTLKVGNVFTFTRTAEPGGINRAILVGDQIHAGPTVKTITDIESAIPSTAGLLSAVNISAGLTSQNLSALTFDNSNGISFGLTGSVITGTVATNYQSQGAYLTTAALSQDSSKYAGTNGAITGGSITVNTSGVSVNLPAYLTTAMASNRGSDFVQATANFFGTNASGTIASNAISISVSAPAGTQSNQTLGLYASSNTYLTSSGTVDARSLTFRGDKSITVGVSNGEVAFSVGAYLTTAMASNRGSDFVQANATFHGTNASGTIASDNFSVSVAAQSVQTQNLVAVSLSGNTAGVLALVSSGTAIFAGGNNITLSQDGQSITISGPNIGGAQTGISGIVVSDTTYTSGTVSFSNQANITIGSSVNGGTQYIRLSGNPAQTNQTVGLYASSNTYLTSSGTVDARSLSFRGDKSITVGISNGEVAFSVGAYITTAMASNRGSDFVAATAAFNGTNASGTIASDAISVSVAAPVPIATAVNAVASANSTGTIARYAPEDHRHAGIGAVGISTSGNTSGTTGSKQGTYWFEGGNSITVSQITSNNGSHTLVLSVGNYLTTAMASNRGSDFVAATAAFNGTNASGTIASNAISVSVAAPIPIATAVNAVASANSTGTVTRYAPEDHRHAGVGAVGISTSGNTAGTTGSEQGTYWFQGGNSITVSQITSNNGSHTLVISAGNYLTTAALSGDTSKYVQAWELTGNTAGTTSSLQGTKIYFEGGNSITVSGNSNTVKFSVGNYLTTADLSQNSSKYVQNWKLTGNTAGTTSSAQGTDLWFEGGNSITVSGNSNTIKLSVGAYLTTAMASNRGSDFVQATAGFNGTNASGTIASNSISVSVAAPIPIATAVKAVASIGSTGTITRYAPEDHQHAGVAAFAVTNTGNTLGNTRSQVGTFYLAASGAITASQSTGAAGNDTIWMSVASQTNQTLGLYGVGNTTGESSSSTFDARTISFKGTGNVSVGYSNGSVLISGASAAPSPVNFSAGTASANLGSVVFSDSNGISFGLSGSTVTASANTVGTATTVYSVASANSVGTVTRWAAEDHRHAGVGGIGISTGNTLGTTGSVLGTYWLQGSNAISVSQITSNNGSHTLNIVGPPHLSYFPLLNQLGNTLTFSFGQSTSHMMQFVLPWNFSFDRMRVVVSGSVAASSTQATTGNTSLSMSAVTSHNIVVYSRGTGASSLSLQYVTSTQHVDQELMTISYNANSTQYSVSLRYTLGSDSFTKDYSVSSGTVNWHTSHLTDLTGPKNLDVKFGVSLSPGQYWVGYGRSTTQATQNGSISVATRMLVSQNSMMAISQNSLALGMLGGGTNSSVGWFPAVGSFTTSGAAGTTSSVEMSAVSTTGSNNVLHAQFMRIV